MPIVKANAYGHDALVCAPWLADAGAPWLVLGNDLVRWDPSGYRERRRRPRRGTATAITPPATLAVLRAGYPVQIDAHAAQDATPSTDPGSIRLT